MAVQQDSPKAAPIYGAINLTYFWLILFPFALLCMQTKYASFYEYGQVDPITLHGGHLRLELAFFVSLLTWCLAMLLRPAEKWRRMRTFAIVVSGFYFAFSLLLIAFIRFIKEPVRFDEVVYFFLHAQQFWLKETGIFIIYVLLIPGMYFVGWWLQFKALKQGTLSPAQGKRLKIYAAVSILALVTALVPTEKGKLENGFVYNPYLFSLISAFNKHGDLVPMTDQQSYPQRHAEFAEHQPTTPNVALILLESVRASALSMNSEFNSPTTPFLDELAKTSLVFDRAYAVLPHTSKSLVAVHCGIDPDLSVYITESTFGLPTDCLPALLKQLGYRTGYFQSPSKEYENRENLVDRLGYDTFYSMENIDPLIDHTQYERVNGELGFEDKAMLPPSEQWLKNGSGPFLATYLTWTSHYGYMTPTTFEDREYSDHIVYNRYLNSVRYVDGFVEALIEQYKSLGLYEDTIFVIVGDHGESMCDIHPACFHSNVMYDEAIQVPMIVHAPGFEGLAGRSDTPVSQPSILPAIMELLGASTGVKEEYVSLLKLFEENAPEKAAPVFAACWYDFACFARTDSQYRYVYKFEGDHHELYDLANDPQQKNNIAGQHQDLVKQFKQEGLDWYGRVKSGYHNYFLSVDPDYGDKMQDTLTIRDLF